MTRPAGWKATTVKCPSFHFLTAVHRTAEGALFAVGLVLDVDTVQPVDCRQCGRGYFVDPVEVRRGVSCGDSYVLATC